MTIVRGAFASLCFLFSGVLFGQASYTATFEPPDFIAGDVSGQDGWDHYVNSPTDGRIAPVPAGTPARFGTQLLEVIGRHADYIGVQNHLYSPQLNIAAGETGSTLGNSGVVVPDANLESTFRATVWFRTPDVSPPLFRPDRRFAELNPSFKAPTDPTANRYAQVRLFSTDLGGGVSAPTVQMGWYGDGGVYQAIDIATLSWGAWFRFEYEIELVDGTNGTAPNDRFNLRIYDLAGALIGSGCGSTWELGWRSGSWGGGATPRAINGFDFWSFTTENSVAYSLDDITLEAVTPAAMTASIDGQMEVCAGGTTPLSVLVANESGTLVDFVWRDDADAIVGTGATFDAGAGTYTVTITDEACRTATSATFTVAEHAPLSASISGSLGVCYGGTTTLTANSAGGSGTIASYAWRDASNAIVGTSATLVAGVGTYTVTVVDGSCGATTSAPVTVAKTCNATPVVSWSNPADIVYGTPLSATQLNATANVAGTFTYTPASGTLLDAGAGQILSVDFTPTDSTNYDSVNGTAVQINVLPATPTVNVVGGTFAYDGGPHPASADAADAASNPVPGSMVITYDGSTTVPVNAGTYAVVATFTSGDPNFTDATGSGTLTITPAVPIVTVTGGTFTYDGTAHTAAAVARDENGILVSGAFTFTYDGSATLPIDVGNYAVVATFTSADPNFTNATGEGSLDIVRAPTAITIDSFSPTPSQRGESVTVNFSLSGIAAGAGGTVTISNGETSCVAAVGTTSCNLVFLTPGSIVVTATYSGDANHLGSSDTAVHSVEIVEATAHVSRDATICRGASASVRVSLTGEAPWTITWSDGVVETVAVSPHFRSVAPNETTTYRLTGVRDANGNGEVTGDARVTVVSVATPAISGPLGARVGEPLTLRATAGLGTYQWFRNGTAIPGATADTLTVVALTEADFASYTVVASSGGCSSSASIPYALVLLGLPTDDDAVIPVVGRTRGVGGSQFRTTLHLVNATEDAMEGEITFINASLPPYPYELEAGETRFIADLLPESFEGLTSADIRRLRGPLPIAVAHVFNEDDDGGTSGMIERAVPLELTLATGDRAVLVTPIDPVTTRFNVGIRSLGDGLDVRVTHRNRDGAVVKVFDRQLPPDTLVHEAAGIFANGAIGSSDSLAFEIISGRGVVYGAATDNGTNDPNIQVPLRREGGASGTYVLPVAGSTGGMFGSRFATALQIHNPSDVSMTATVRFHPAGTTGTDADPQLILNVPARGTLGLDDVVGAIGASGLGSLDLITSGGIRPVLLSRIYSIAEAGQTSLMTELVAEEDVLIAGDSGVFVAPASPEALRFNVGVRTLAAGVRATATVRNAAGDVVRIVPLSFPANWFEQTTAVSLLGVESFAGNESVTFSVEEGSAIVYGVWTDNVTQDPALQLAVRP